MADDFIKIYNDLVDIRKYLIKKGQARFTGSIAPNKLKEANDLFSDAQLLYTKLSHDLKPELVTQLSTTFDNIKGIFLNITELCTLPPSVIKIVKMEFDIRTACNLIPLMDGKEDTTKRLIDAVEMYADMLDDSGKKLLVKFVLKGRLSENAKLRLSNNYDTVPALIQDLRKHLLTTKSFTAIQSRLQNINQGFRSIDEYGSELEQLFTDLTISQADGDSTKFTVLKPLNEKMPIKRFSDGLKSSRLSTIVAARNYDSLKDAIQSAKDEEVSSPSTSAKPDVMQYSRRSRGRFTPSSGPRGRRHRGRNFDSFNNYNHRGYGRPFQNSHRGRSYLQTNFYNGRFYHRGNRRGNIYRRNNIFSAQPIPPTQEPAQGPISQNSNDNTQYMNNKQFFRF